MAELKENLIEDLCREGFISVDHQGEGNTDLYETIKPVVAKRLHIWVLSEKLPRGMPVHH